MPCNSDHMEANAMEKAASRISCYIDEVDGFSWHKRDHDGYYPGIYNKCDQAKIDKLTSELCEKLKDKTPEDIRDYSLELQMWWRDHQKWDEKRERADAMLKERAK